MIRDDLMFNFFPKLCMYWSSFPWRRYGDFMVHSLAYSPL